MAEDLSKAGKRIELDIGTWSLSFLFFTLSSEDFTGGYIWLN